MAVQSSGIQAPSTNSPELSPETYLGYGRAENFSSTKAFLEDEAANYSAPKVLELNQWALLGQWHVSEEKTTSTAAKSKIQFRFQARDLHLVLGGEKKIKFRVTLDGKSLGENHGVDTDENGFGTIEGHRLYQLIRLKEPNQSKGPHSFEIEFFESGASAYAFTFG